MLHDHSSPAQCVPTNASRSRRSGAGGTGPGAARGELRRQAHPSIPISLRRSTVAPFMQLALSDSSAVRPAASLSSNATGFDQDDAAGLAAERAFDCHLLEKRLLLEADACECTLQMQPSARPVYLRAYRPRSTCSSGRACHPHACYVCPSAGQQFCRLLCARKAAPRHACRRTPLLRASCADAAAVAAPPHACSA